MSKRRKARRLVLLDANVCLRFLTIDPTAPEQSAQAQALIVGAPQGSLYLVALVVAEVIWNLRGHYRFSRSETNLALQKLISNASILVEHDVLAALQRFALTNLDFTDCLLASAAEKSGQPVSTFDRDFRKFRDVTALSPVADLDWLKN